MSNSNQPFNENNGYDGTPAQQPVQNPVPQYNDPQQPGINPPPYGQSYPQQPGGYPQQNPQAYGGQPSGGYQPPYPQQNYPAGMPYMQQMPMISEKEFIEKYAPQLKKNFNAVAIALYCLLGIGLLGTVVLSFMGMSNWLALADYAVLLALLIPFHLTRKMGWAIGLLAFGILEVLVFLIMYQMAGGLGWLVGGIVALTISLKCRRQYKAFLMGDPYYYTR